MIEVEKQFSNAAHAYATDAYEVNVVSALVHFSD
jgi:hypothetical protein